MILKVKTSCIKNCFTLQSNYDYSYKKTVTNIFVTVFFNFINIYLQVIYFNCSLWICNNPQTTYWQH